MKWYAVVVSGKTYWCHCYTPEEALAEYRKHWMSIHEVNADFAVYEAVPKLHGIEGSTLFKTE